MNWVNPTIFQRNGKVSGVLILVMLLSIAVFGQSASYRVQKGDRLNISFWEYPEMNTISTVSRDGDIELPTIGRINVAGLIISEVRSTIVSKMAIYNKLVNQLNIAVVEYGQNVVYVTGNVLQPGKFSFEEIPNLWNIILEAGGPNQSATLDNISIVRNDGNGQVLTVNLAYALQNGKLAELPKIRPRDTININGLTPTGENTPSPLTEKAEVFIVGAVQTPGPQRFEENLNLLEAIGRAGGPTADANLKKTTYVVVENGNTRIVKLNLKDYLTNPGTRPVPMLRQGSTLYIPENRPSQLVTAIISSLITGAIATTAILVTR